MVKIGRRGGMLKFVLGCVLAALVTGCATPSRNGGIDADGMLTAISIDDVGYVRGILASGAATPNSRIPAPAYPDGAPLITLAARDGAIEIVRYLLAAGADVNAVTPVGETAVMLATYFPGEGATESARERYESLVRTLVDAGASVENQVYQYTPLSYAAYQNRQHLMSYLLAKGAHVDGELAAGGVTYTNTPLMMAAIQGHYDAAVWLLHAGANPRIRSYRGTTAAELAAKYNHQRLASLLRCAQQVTVVASIDKQCH